MPALPANALNRMTGSELEFDPALSAITPVAGRIRAAAANDTAAQVHVTRQPKNTTLGLN